jgi:hypothetical protein
MVIGNFLFEMLVYIYSRDECYDQDKKSDQDKFNGHPVQFYLVREGMIFLVKYFYAQHD